MKPTRRQQPYRKGLGTKMAGAAHDAMRRGAPQGLPNPMDAKRLGQKMAKRTKGKHWIAGAVKHPGALHADLGVPQGQKIPQGMLAAAAKRKGKVGQRARLAQTFKRMH